MKETLSGLFLLLAPALRAQPVAGSVAQVYTVTSDRCERFRMPQVRLPDAAVARRINRQLQQQLLSFEFTKDNNGLTELAAEHLTFDLRTGKRLTLDDVVADPPAKLAQRMDWAVERRLKDELANVAAIYGDSAVIADVALMYGLESWNTVRQEPTVAGTSTDGNWFEWADFALNDHALLLFHNVSMSRVSVEFLPGPVYTFPYARIQPRGLLVPLAKAAAVKKSKTK